MEFSRVENLSGPRGSIFCLFRAQLNPRKKIFLIKFLYFPYSSYVPSLLLGSLSTMDLEIDCHWNFGRSQPPHTSQCWALPRLPVVHWQLLPIIHYHFHYQWSLVTTHHHCPSLNFNDPLLTTHNPLSTSHEPLSSIHRQFSDPN